MSMRVKAGLIIMSIVFAVTAAYYFLSIFFTRQNLVKTIEQDLAMAVEIANDLIATQISLTKSELDSIAVRLLAAESNDEMAKLMVSQMEEFDDFISLTVFDRESIVACHGEPVSYDLFDSEEQYIQVAFGGERIFSTTHYSGITGAFIMYVFVPMGNDRVLSASVPGMLFSNLLVNYRLWDTGNIFMVDKTGTFVAHYRPELVKGRYNFIDQGEKNPAYRSRSNFFREIISNDNGLGTYSLDGIERLCIYKHITGSRAGWRIAVAAPLNESPMLTLRNDLLLSAMCFLLAGIVISVLVSGIVARPFAKIEEQNRSLAELNERVMAASDAKSVFLARMSHEMRTPLNAIIGLSELSLEAGTVIEEDYSNLEKINNAGITLLSTVNDILDISKIESGKFELIPVEYDTPSLINDTVTQNIMRIGEKPIEFNLNIDWNVPARLYGDDLRIRQILNNLLSNAFKYTREGSVDLNVSCVREDDSVWLYADVRDTGMGIKSENIGSLFENFVQVDTKSHRKIEGTGLGLSITKKMAEMMDGSVSVESEYGKGSVFKVKLRQGFVTDVTIGVEVANSLRNFNYTDHRRKKYSRMERIRMPYAKVLVVDDVATNLDVAKGMMKPYEMQIDCVISGQEAIDAIRAEKVKYDAVFMDQMMPGMDGLEATRIIREEIGTEYAKTVPIIALTANAIVGNEEMFLSRGFQAFLSKPIEIKRLDSVLHEWVRDEEKEKALGDQKNDMDHAPDRRMSLDRRNRIDRRAFGRDAGGIDIEKGIERFGGDEESFFHVLRSYAINTPPLIESIRAVDRDNLGEYAITVHGLKSSSRGICAEAVGAMAEALEKAAKQGDLNFVAVNNSDFIHTVEKLLGTLSDMLAKMTEGVSRPKRDKPDEEILSRLVAACRVFKMDDVDAAMTEIENYEYEADDGLALWLRENVELMNFLEIIAKLSGETSGG